MKNFFYKLCYRGGPPRPDKITIITPKKWFVYCMLFLRVLLFFLLPVRALITAHITLFRHATGRKTDFEGDD